LAENVELHYIDELINPAREDGRLATGVACQTYVWNEDTYAWVAQTLYGGGGGNATGAYKISGIDNPYYGYLKGDGSWYIMKIDGTEVKYVKGDTGYATNWGNRASRSDYDYYDNIV
jgi:hypothetical protein